MPTIISFNPLDSRRWLSLFVGLNEGWSLTQGLTRLMINFLTCLPDPVLAIFFQKREKAYSLDATLLLCIFIKTQFRSCCCLCHWCSSFLSTGVDALFARPLGTQLLFDGGSRCWVSSRRLYGAPAVRSGEDRFLPPSTATGLGRCFSLFNPSTRKGRRCHCHSG